MLGCVGAPSLCVRLPDVISAAGEVTRPVARLPEAVAVHLSPALAERGVTVRSSLQVEVTQLLQVRPDDLQEDEASATQEAHKIRLVHLLNVGLYSDKILIIINL